MESSKVFHKETDSYISYILTTSDDKTLITLGKDGECFIKDVNTGF